MSPRDDGRPTDVLNEYPEDFEHGKLVGVPESGVPVYYEPTDQRAYEVIRSGGHLEPREPRWKGPIESVIEDIEDAIGWDALTEFGKKHRED